MRSEVVTGATLNSSRLETLGEAWKHVTDDFKLGIPKAAAFAKGLHGEPGTYLWTLVTGSEKYCMYVGKCRNFSKRMYAYTQSFQPHAPNDRKLAFAQMALRELFSDATFALYFKPCALAEIDAMETRAIATFSPILNRRAGHSRDTEKEFEAMYEAYYRRVLGSAFSDA